MKDGLIAAIAQNATKAKEWMNFFLEGKAKKLDIGY
jgi:hypothetical protein